MGTTQIFLLIALVATGIFLIQFILSIFFGDMDVDVDADSNVDADLSSVVSFKGLVHFGIGFGWAMYLSGNTTWQSYLIAIGVGLVFVFVLWKLYIFAYKLQKVNRAENPLSLIGRPATIYANCGGGRYIVQILHNGALRELDVVSASQCIAYRTGDRVTVEAYKENIYYIH